MNFDALHDSRSTREALGLPIPDSPHAVSVCLPLWEHNIGYEEGDTDVTGRMQTGYPRFFLHPLVRRLMSECDARFSRSEEGCVPFPSRQVAERCAEYVRARSGEPCHCPIHDFGTGGIWAVAIPKPAFSAGLDFWQHTGEIVSSRLAQQALEGAHFAPTEDSGRVAKGAIRDRIAALAGAEPEDVLLYPTGMAAVFAAYRVFQQLRPNRRSIQFGFPYVDTLKLQQKFGPLPAGGNRDPGERVAFIPEVESEALEQVERLTAEQGIAAVYCEFPCNPLLASPDLDRLSALCRSGGVPLLVDDTLATFVNADVLPSADVLTSSLTKFFSGCGDVMGGSLILNRRGTNYAAIREVFDADGDDLLFGEDAIVLERNSRDFADRVPRINVNAEKLCDFLAAHPRVARVYYPKYNTPESYQARLKPGGGYGGLFSLDLHDAPTAAPAFFDRLRICKGPNLGTNFTLCCPYTILAHYRELEFVERCGVSRYLLRVSVGLEEPKWLIGRFGEALDSLK